MGVPVRAFPEEDVDGERLHNDVRIAQVNDTLVSQTRELAADCASGLSLAANAQG